MSRIIKILFCLIFAMPAMAQLSSLTSNYLFNLFAVNPAYAGQRRALDATAFYRKQWVGLNGSPETYGAMAHMEIKPKNFGLGIQIQNDKIGLFLDSRISVAFAYKVKFNKTSSLSFAVSPGFKRTTTDFNKIVTTQSGDGTFADFRQPINTFLSGAGLFFTNNKFYLGFSTPDLLQTSSTIKQVEFNLMAGYVYKINENLSIKPFTLIRGIKNAPLQFDASFAAYLNQIFGVGLSYRNRESILLFSEILLKKQFKFGYAYDYNVGSIRKFNSGTHEIMINYFFGKTTNAATPRFF
jgi:type IX secretion system PorP/SprF family membrane protein